jgi:hypothetical protein
MAGAGAALAAGAAAGAGGAAIGVGLNSLPSAFSLAAYFCAAMSCHLASNSLSRLAASAAFSLASSAFAFCSSFKGGGAGSLATAGPASDSQREGQHQSCVQSWASRSEDRWVAGPVTDQASRLGAGSLPCDASPERWAGSRPALMSSYQSSWCSRAQVSST